MTLTMTRKKHAPGCYRITRENSPVFGQARRFGREWHAEIRETDSGDLIRMAGIWPSLTDAQDEIEWIILRKLSADRGAQA